MRSLKWDVAPEANDRNQHPERKLNPVNAVVFVLDLLKLIRSLDLHVNCYFVCNVPSVTISTKLF